MVNANEKHDDSPTQGATDAQRAGVRKTVTIIAIFVIAVFAWTIVGRLIN